MNEVFGRYIGKDCVIYISNSSSNVIECRVTGVSDNWLTVESRDGVEIINVDYIIRIKEHPVNKNGKKKVRLYKTFGTECLGDSELWVDMDGVSDSSRTLFKFFKVTVGLP